ncbi:MAG: hypothetical protein JW855_05510 [Gammaproteobacteria bacterium]|nr:hypothetical protein [Gammaproteobacteria bacterium]
MKGQKIFLFIIFISLCFLSFMVIAQMPYRLSTSLSKMVDTETLAPGNFNYFIDFKALSLNENGQFVFVGDAKRDYKGVYTNLLGPLSIVADKDTVIPGYKDKKFVDFSEGESLAFLGKKIVFLGRAYYEPPTLYEYDQGTLTKIADLNTRVPSDGLVTFTQFLKPKISADNAIFFIGQGNDNLYGIYERTPEGQLKALLPPNSPIPGQKDYFVQISHFAINHTNHDFAFVGRGKNNLNGLYMSHNGKIYSLVDKTVLIPGGVGYFNDIGKIAFNSKTGQIAFIGKGVLGQTGLYFYDGKVIKKLVDQRTLLPQGAATFGEIYNVMMNNGNIVFCGSDYHEDGIYLYTDKGLFKIISTLDAINDARINKVFLGQGFNGNQVGVIVTFDRGASAIYIIGLKLTNI